jgi:hypothetical protein
MDNEQTLIVFEKYKNAVDANIVKGAIEASGIPAGVIGDSTANAIWMAPVMVVVFRRDLEEAIKAVYAGDLNYEEYQDEMSREQFDNLQACNKAFSELLLKVHPEIGGKQYRDIYSQAKDALDRMDLEALNRLNALV